MGDNMEFCRSDNELSVSEAAQELSVSSQELYAWLESGLLSSVINVRDKNYRKYPLTRSVLPVVRAVIEENSDKKAKFLSNSSHRRDTDVARIMGVPVGWVVAQIEEHGMWDHAVVGFYYSWNSNRKIYVFNMDDFNSMRTSWNLEEIARKVGVARSTILKYMDAHVIQMKHIDGTALYECDITEVGRALTHGAQNLLRDKGKLHPVSCWDLCGASTKAFINHYIDFRKTFKLTGPGSSFPVLTDPETHVRTLGTIAFCLVCRRSNVAVPPLHRLLESPQGYDPDVFSFRDLNEGDISFLREETGWNNNTFHDKLRFLKPLIVYTIRMCRKEADYETASRLTDLIEILPTLPSAYGEFDQDKVFLSRSEVMQVYELIRSDPTVSSKLALRNATMWMIGCFLGVRPEEQTKLRIRHFDLNAQGMLSVDESGWGMLTVPSEVSKQGRASYRNYGNPVVPELVGLINEYLNLIYSDQEPGTDGWLFRSFTKNPEDCLKHTPQWIGNLRPSMEFLEPKRRSRVELKTSRRSMNEFIDGTTLPLEYRSLEKYQKEVAQIHMRHTRLGTVGDRHYRNSVPLSMHRQILDLTLNFPWDLRRLRDWEAKHGYLHATVVSHVEAPRETRHDDSLSTVAEQLELLKQDMTELQKQPPNLSVTEWLKAKAELRDRIVNLEHKQRNI